MAVAQREPRRARLPAHTTAPDRGCVDLEPKACDDSRRGGFLELCGPLDRDPAYPRVLQCEPAQNACGSASLLCLLERRVAEARRVKEKRQQRPLCRIAADSKGE